MAYTNSSLVNFTLISPNRNSPRNHTIDRITPHCYVGQANVESMANWLKGKPEYDDRRNQKNKSKDNPACAAQGYRGEENIVHDSGHQCRYSYYPDNLSGAVSLFQDWPQQKYVRHIPNIMSPAIVTKHMSEKADVGQNTGER